MNRSVAAALIRQSAPDAPELHLVESGIGFHALVVDASRLYDLDGAAFRALRAAVANGEAKSALSAMGLQRPVPVIDDMPPVSPPVRAVSLAVAQKCNLACGYCYAREGSFGGAPKDMALATACASIDLLFSETAKGDRVNLAFLGGEPLVNRDVVRAATVYAAREGVRRNVGVGFSITTNGTLLNDSDAEFFEEHGFAVTVSLDGPRELHDRQRPYKGGGGSFAAVQRRLTPLLARQKRMQVSARVTVTPAHTDLPRTLAEFIGMGFFSVGFSPMLNSPTGEQEMDRDDLVRMLDGMVACGVEFERRTAAGERYPFANILNALKEIHRGTHRPYPCGAGAGYLGVSAAGELAACHRFVGDEAGALGTLAGGLDRSRQAAWLRERHVHRQEPCRSCWARYLCGGSCHHEVINRERRACEYIRGWLHYCIGAYARLALVKPVVFADDFAAAS
jgi:uncharacterized protein